MNISFAVGIMDAVTRENLTETGDLVIIQDECESDPEFASALANACGLTHKALLEKIDSGIRDIRSHHTRLERRERGGYRGRRW